MKPLEQTFLGQIADKQMPQNAPPKFFKKVKTILGEMQIKFETGNKRVSTPSIEQKSS